MLIDFHAFEFDVFSLRIYLLILNSIIQSKLLYNVKNETVCIGKAKWAANVAHQAYKIGERLGVSHNEQFVRRV